ncbi:MAG: hypothetical protein V3U75_11235 [Methylococcaceae bacterium]
MKNEELEPEMDALIQRLEPDITSEWRGATEDEIDQIEKIVKNISGKGLPKFYRWFLMRMGHSMGQLSIPDMDYSASTVISYYKGGDEVEDEDAKFLLIGHSSEGRLRLNMYYDLGHLARDDARVTKRAGDGGDDFKQFETFREMIAWRTMLFHCVEKFAKTCEGTLYDDSGENIFLKFGPLMTRLGFTKSPVPTGPFCGLYEGSEAAMVTLDLIDFDTDESDGFAFTLGGMDANCLRRILGEIATVEDFVLEVDDDPHRLGYGS